ncbi:MAG: ATP-binding cassette domain-containing protein [Jiangellales bacterium]
MIRFDDVTITYPGAGAPTLSHVDLTVAEGEMCLVVGPTGTGKSTLLRAVNGLVPHFTGGTLAGTVAVDGRSTRAHRPRDLADVVGLVLQDPTSGFVADVVEDELAFGMEWLGLAPAVMRRRVEETLDLLGLTELRHRPLGTLSGGQRQRVAIGAALTVHPRVLVLDEPTSALDPQGAEDVLAALQRLVHDLGLTVLVAEHRLERVVQYADRVVELSEHGTLRAGDPVPMMSTCQVAPPVVELGRLAGWSPLPLSVRDARRHAGDLRRRLGALDTLAPAAGRAPEHALSLPVAEVTDLRLRYGDVTALRGVSMQVRPGEVMAVMGRNGAGKSSLLSCLAGLARPQTGRISVGGLDPRRASPETMVATVGLVPQQPGDLLYATSVTDECTTADQDAGRAVGATRRVLAEMAPDVDVALHPRDLSEGQRLLLALSIVLASEPALLLLDEPTRGLDYHAKRRLIDALQRLVTNGHAVILATHDVELVAEVCSRVAILADGDVVTDGPAADVLASSPAFAPQVAKVLAPQPWLSVRQVADALELAG